MVPRGHGAARISDGSMPHPNVISLVRCSPSSGGGAARYWTASNALPGISILAIAPSRAPVLPAGGLRLCRAGVEPAGSLREVSVHRILLSRAFSGAITVRPARGIVRLVHEVGACNCSKSTILSRIFNEFPVADNQAK